MSDNLYEVIGRKQAELETMHAEYNKLLSVLHGVVTGVLKAENVTVNLEGRSWTHTLPALDEEAEAPCEQ